MRKHLYDEIEKRWFRGGSIWLYSDPHFNDDEMKHIRKDYVGDDEQIRRINSKVGKKDTIIILGDIGDVEPVKRIRGYKVLVMGNHDKGASNYKREVETVERFSSEGMTDEDRDAIKANLLAHMNGDKEALSRMGDDVLSKYTTTETIDNRLFDEVYEGPVMVNDRLILSHEPIDNLPPYMFNIHGHDHSEWKKGERMMNVCAEHIGYTPVNFTKLLDSGLLSDVKSIHRCAIDNAGKGDKE